METMSYSSSILITKINLVSKALEWSTYMYGSDPSVSYPSAAIAVDDNFLYCNSTMSLSGMATLGAQDNTLSGPLDIFISKLSLNGELIWSRYYGGLKKEFAGGICAENGQIFIGGTTASTNAISTSGVPFQDIHHSTTSSTTLDMCFASFDANGSLLWGTYFGDYANEARPSFLTVKDHSIWASSNSSNTSTESMHAPFATSDAFQLENAGGTDAVIIKFDLPTGITENNSSQVLSIYPNPTSGLCSVIGLKDISSIDVVSITGQMVLRSNVGVGQSQISLDLSELSSGYYTLRIFDAKGESKGQYPVVRQ